MDNTTIQKIMPAETQKTWLQKHDPAIFLWLCTGIAYSMLFWTYLCSLISIVLTAYWLFFSEKKIAWENRRAGLMLVFTSLYLAAVIGMLYTENKAAGFFTLQKQSALFFFPLIFGTTVHCNWNFINKLLFHIVIATSLTCAAGLIYGLLHFRETGDLISLTGSHLLFFNDLRPVTMGLFCLLSLTVLFDAPAVSVGITGKWRWLLTILISLFIILLSIRLIIFLWIITVIFFSWKLIKNFYAKMLLALSIIIIMIVSFSTIPSLKRQWAELTDFSVKTEIILDEDASLGRDWGGKALRIAIWKSAIDLAGRHWLTGVGTGDVQDSLQQAYEDRKFYFASRYNRYNAHNEYLQVWLGHGVIGFAALLSCILLPVISYRKNYSGRSYHCFLFIFAVVCLTESLLEVNKGIMWYSFFNSIFAFGLFNISSKQNN